MAARKGRTFEMSNEHRDKIKNSNILNALIEHVEGEREMSATQVSAGLGLLRKVMPDLAQSEVTHQHLGPVNMTDEEIIARLAELRGSGASDELAEAPLDPSQLH